MPDLLLELLSEEIPARMQARAAEDLKKRITDGLVEAGLVYEGAKAFATPRRLALTVHGIPARSADVVEERKGPRVGSPDQALQGFLKSAGLASIAEASIETDPKKGDFYVARLKKPGREAVDILADTISATIRTFPWPKSMRWGAASAEPGSLTWVRPLTSILATFGPETEEPVIVPVRVDGVATGDRTSGHRFMAPASFRVKRFEDYVTSLEAAKVVLDPERRKAMIMADARALCMANGLELVEDQGLLDEVAGLVEWPVVLLGTFEEAFLDIPAEVIRATIRANQKCFVTKRADGSLANRFVLVSNIEARDGGVAIANGNARVVRARLSDASYFWTTDRKTRLEDRLPKFDKIVFHEKLGTQGARIQRLETLSRTLAPMVGADPDLAGRAARLAKADLLTEVVGEFPEVQGLMGRRYAELQGEPLEISVALEAHYKPVGPSDTVPTAPVSIAVALADKLDILTGFWSIDEKPTGSKDPFALRRAALGVIRIVVDNQITLPLSTWCSDDLLAFFHDRLKVQLKDSGARHDLVDAVLASGRGDDLLQIVRRVEALGSFLKSADGAALLAGVKRGANILRIEEKKDGQSYTGAVDANKLGASEERALNTALVHAGQTVSGCVAASDFSGALAALASLRPTVDAFFEAILVNDPDPATRANRLQLLAALRATAGLIADLSRVDG